MLAISGTSCGKIGWVLLAGAVVLLLKGERLDDEDPPQRVPQQARVASGTALMLSIIDEMRFMLSAGTAEGGIR